jgi:hypothetical protein
MEGAIYYKKVLVVESSYLPANIRGGKPLYLALFRAST